jgi:hypothetical protein
VYVHQALSTWVRCSAATALVAIPVAAAIRLLLHEIAIRWLDKS